MGAINPVHVMFVAVIALLVLGPKRLPEVGRSLGRSLHEFKHGLHTQVESEPAELNAGRRAASIETQDHTEAGATAAAGADAPARADGGSADAQSWAAESAAQENVSPNLPQARQI